MRYEVSSIDAVWYSRLDLQFIFKSYRYIRYIFSDIDLNDCTFSNKK